MAPALSSASQVSVSEPHQSGRVALHGGAHHRPATLRTPAAGHGHTHRHDGHDHARADGPVLRPIRIAPSIIRMSLLARLVAAAAISGVLVGLTTLVI